MNILKCASNIYIKVTTNYPVQVSNLCRKGAGFIHQIFFGPNTKLPYFNQEVEKRLFEEASSKEINDWATRISEILNKK